MNDNIKTRNGIISAGNWLVDFLKIIEVYPSPGNLVTIESVEKGLGGCAHNVLVDLARMRPGFPLYAGGCVGNDENGKYILSQVKEHGIDDTYMRTIDGVPTSYTDAMVERSGGRTRTFFHCRGANACLGLDQIEAMVTSAKIFHLGYLLLLDSLDRPDPEYGVVGARALKSLREMGYRTSVDLVSEQSDRFNKVVLPCLPYVDYLIINEIEASKCSGLTIRKDDGTLDWENLKESARILIGKGVRGQVSLHMPEGGFTRLANGEEYFAASKKVTPEQIVSCVGAGDAFCAGMLYAVHQGFEPKRALDFANMSARFNLFDATSTGGAPAVEEIMRSMASCNE